MICGATGSTASLAAPPGGLLTRVQMAPRSVVRMIDDSPNAGCSASVTAKLADVVVPAT